MDSFLFNKDVYKLIDVLTTLKVVGDVDAGVARRRTFPALISLLKVDNNSPVCKVPYSVSYVIFPSWTTEISVVWYEVPLVIWIKYFAER